MVDASAATEEEISLQDVIAKTLMGHLCVKAGLSNFEIYCYRSDSQANGIEALIKLLEGAQKDNSNMIDIFRLRAVKLPSLDTDSNVGGSGQGPGGIDFRAMPMAVQPDSVGRLAGVPVSRLNGPHINLDIELREIQRMIRAGIIPSLERIKECLVASCQGKDCRQKREKILACLADILRMEEERAVDTESQMKEVLVLLESDKPAVELEAALSKIVVMPGEPKGAE